MKRSLRRWLLPLAWMGVIFFFSAQPSLPHAPSPWFDLILKKLGHAFAYGILAWLYLQALRNEGSNATALRAASAALALAYALSDEYHQSFVPGRNASWVDVTVDGVGACGAMLLDWWRERRGAQSAAASQ